MSDSVLEFRLKELTFRELQLEANQKEGLPQRLEALILP